MGITKVLLMVIVQSFYLHLIWVLSSNPTIKKSLVQIIRSMSTVILIYALGMGGAFVGHLVGISTIFTFSGPLQIVTYIAHGSAAFIDCSIAAILSFVLFKASGDTAWSSRSVSVVRYLVLYFVGMGVLTALTAIIKVILYALKPSSVIYLAIDFSVPSLYANSILALFNAKSRLKKKIDASVGPQISSALFGDPVGPVLSHPAG
ncbi:hypothetical protein GALMADRAFT_244138 [Galerina marginata CBS 339.88]|uniref:DUF6534 domain-containing protein n=1 Tax=Galerina marginata (strain CBS 339.88) TaxID=685588 RepID=A0A067TI55_GALM3|nr:hypothetical protein GALMADRAFT_244138 [Galerina marginata CBS 339.88]